MPTRHIIPPPILACIIFAQQVFAATRYSNNYWAARWLNSTDLEACHYRTARTPPPGQCYEMANCILESLSEYAKVGLASGTSVLSLVPSALALIPARGSGVEEIFETMGVLYFLLSIFSGYVRIGDASSHLAKEIGAEPNAAEAQFERGREKYRLGKRHYAFCGLTAALAGITVFLATELGVQTVVTWACNHELLHVGWLFCRMLPGLAEFALVRLVRRMLQNRPSWSVGGVGSRGWILAKGANGLSLALYGLVVIYGTGLFGSTNLIDGGEVMWKYMVMFPLLYFVMQSMLAAGTVWRISDSRGCRNASPGAVALSVRPTK
ncbi:hypothetical protein EJ06DRAFT_525604 [Trichodelitschia bisporula]|uniref:Integral membrane protein n=1 Tax=Trichodelitschia bisporula TaxID=703511 RepID=A0A6G1IAM2_9PEZI|nr:hypothetical protein EJ06DRAFT_525604 [Trichodelitschia bisporula]